jgi:hypothetical protein
MCKALQAGQRSAINGKCQPCSGDRNQRVELVKEKITSIYFNSKHGSPRMTAELVS